MPGKEFTGELVFGTGRMDFGNSLLSLILINATELHSGQGVDRVRSRLTE